jgi:hypothetical protein
MRIWIGFVLSRSCDENFKMQILRLASLAQDDSFIVANFRLKTLAR